MQTYQIFINYHLPHYLGLLLGVRNCIW